MIFADIKTDVKQKNKRTMIAVSYKFSQKHLLKTRNTM